MADTPTVVYAPDGTLSVPNTFTVAPTQLLDLALAQATFDGSGAGGDFIPCLSIYAQSGQLLMRATSSTVTQGDNAEVSWFPFAEQQAAAAPSGGTGASALGWYDKNRTGGGTTVIVGANSSTYSKFQNVYTSDATQLSWSTTTNPNDTLSCKGTGIFVLYSTQLWDTLFGALYGVIQAANESIRSQPVTPQTNPSTVPVGGLASSLHYTVIINATSTTSSARVLSINDEAFAHECEASYFAAFKIPTA